MRPAEAFPALIITRCSWILTFGKRFCYTRKFRCLKVYPALPCPGHIFSIEVAVTEKSELWVLVKPQSFLSILCILRAYAVQSTQLYCCSSGAHFRTGMRNMKNTCGSVRFYAGSPAPPAPPWGSWLYRAHPGHRSCVLLWPQCAL